MNVNMVDIMMSWLLSVWVLGDLCVGVIIYCNVICEYMLVEMLEVKFVNEKILVVVVERNIGFC